MVIAKLSIYGRRLSDSECGSSLKTLGFLKNPQGISRDPQGPLRNPRAPNIWDGGSIRVTYLSTQAPSLFHSLIGILFLSPERKAS